MAKEDVKNKVSGLGRFKNVSPANVRAGSEASDGGSTSEPRLQSRQVDEAVATMYARELYTRDRHIFLMRVIYLLSVLLMLASIMNILQFMQPIKMRYFATDGDGKIKELIALNRPIEPVSVVSTWLTDSVIRSYTFSFANYRQELSEASKNFTSDGWKGFQRALEDSGNLKAVIDNKYVTTAAPTGAPVLLVSGLVGDRWAWKFQVPIVITYQSASNKTSQNLLITALVVRQPDTDSPRGLGIASLIAE